MKAKKLLLTLLLLCIAILSTAGCTGDKFLAKPEDTSLEFWVAQNVAGVDFSGHYKVPYVSGANIYYGKSYQPAEIIEGSEVIPPEHYVIYTVTAYPDYSSDNGNFDTVTKIQITDPQVSVYGITCNSDLKDFDAAFEKLGCTIQDKGLIHIAAYGKVKIALASNDADKTLTIWVDVTNKQGIVF